MMRTRVVKVFVMLLLSVSSIGLSQQGLRDFYGNPVDSSLDSLSFATTEEAIAVVKRITDQFGLVPEFAIYESTSTQFAEARLVAGERMILYNPAFMRRAASNDWVPLAILAHEIGHHLNNHLPVRRPPHELELEADYFSGFALAKLGATLTQAQAAVRQETPIIRTAGHPARAVRLAEVERGWQAGRATMSASLPADGSVLQPGQESELIRRAQQGGVIRLAAGTFRLTQPLRLASSVEIIGAGQDATILQGRHTVDNEAVLRFTGSGTFALRNLTVEYTGSSPSHVIWASSGTVDVQNTKVQGARDGDNISGAGLHLSGKVRGQVEGALIQDNQNSGIFMDDRANVDLQNNTVRNNERSGIYYWENAGGTASGNIAEGNGGNGIYVGGEARPTLQNNTVRNNERSGIGYEGNASGTASGNITEGNSTNGIYVGGEARPTLQNNTARNNEQSGIAYWDNASGTATGNTTENNGIQGIVCGDQARAILASNTSRNNTRYGIAMHTTASCTEAGNQVTGNRLGNQVYRWTP